MLLLCTLLGSKLFKSFNYFLLIYGLMVNLPLKSLKKCKSFLKHKKLIHIMLAYAFLLKPPNCTYTTSLSQTEFSTFTRCLQKMAKFIKIDEDMFHEFDKPNYNMEQGPFYIYFRFVKETILSTTIFVKLLIKLHNSKFSSTRYDTDRIRIRTSLSSSTV